MKKWLFLFLIAALLPVRALGAEDTAPACSAEAMILLHPASGTVLAGKCAQEERLIASTTKLMTALVAAIELPMDRSVTIEREWTAVEGSSMYLRPGENYTVRELLEGLLLASGNDAAIALSVTVSGDVESFAERMNREAKALGLKHTHFENPHGLDSPGHYSCAADLAKLMAAALKTEPLREIMGLRSCRIHDAVYENHNKLLRSCRGVFAGKTGYTMAAGRCLVTACERDGLELICVTLSDADDWRDHAQLYDWAFRHYKVYEKKIGESVREIPVLSGREETAWLTIGEELSLCVGEQAEIRAEISAPEFVFAPVSAGAVAGELRLYVDGAPIACLPLQWCESRSRSACAEVSLRDIADRLFGVYRIETDAG